MAGLHALFGYHSRNHSWYKCSDGKVLEPVDIFHLLFPNEGCGRVGNNVCFIPRRFSFPPLQELFPPRSKLFTPDDLVDCIVCLLVLCVLITVAIPLIKVVWEALDPTFTSISPPHKKWYVIANLTKAFLLALLALSSRHWIGSFYYGLVHNDAHMIEVKRCSIIYISCDIVALYMVSKLPWSTLMHHIVTLGVCILVVSTNLEEPGWDGLLGVSKMCLIYGIFSSVAFSVNAYLALRVVYPKAQWLHGLIKLSLWTYIVCCAGNWSLHAAWLLGRVYTLQFSIYNLLYMVPGFFMVNDDIVLIKWLIRKGSPMAVKHEP